MAALPPTFLGKREYLKYSLLSLFLPLFSRLERGKADKQFTRGQIFQYVCDNPGASYNQTKAALKLKNGTLAYHLDILMRELRTCEEHNVTGIPYLTSRRDGQLKRFYTGCPACAETPKEDFDIQARILDAIKSNPGITQIKLAKLVGMSRQALNYNIKQLAAQGKLRLEGEGRKTHCYVVGTGD